jgi:hypothetical protein
VFLPVCGIIIGTLQPRFMNPEAWNWGGKTAFFWAGANLFGLVWVSCFSPFITCSFRLIAIQADRVADMRWI